MDFNKVFRILGSVLSKLFYLAIMLHLSSILIASDVPQEKYYLVHNDVGTVGEYFIIDGKEIGIQFTESSNEIALAALHDLNVSIFLPNTGNQSNLILVGKLFPEIHRTLGGEGRLTPEDYRWFRLDMWYLLAPFTEDQNYLPEHRGEYDKDLVIKKTTLTKADFECPIKGDPSIYVKRRGK